MTTVHINLPDDLAQNAQQAGLLQPEAIETMLRAQLKRQAGDALQALWAQAPEESLTPIQAARAERRKRAAS
jgi:hypothetical protein